jgi:hypothetical protein
MHSNQIANRHRRGQSQTARRSEAIKWKKVKGAATARPTSPRVLEGRGNQIPF